MPAKLYVILGSHACRTGMLLLEHKGIDYRAVTLPTGLHPLALRLAGFPANPEPFRHVDDRRHRAVELTDRMGTVPALELDGHRVKTNRGIARFLEQLRPDPPLFPADAEQRRAVEEAQAWGDDVLQMVARRVVLGAIFHGPDALVDRGGSGRLGPLLWRNDRMRLIGVQVVRRFFAVDAGAERELMEAVPPALDRIDTWIEAGVLGAEQANAADLMIAPSLALLCYRPELAAEIEGRPAMRLVDRFLPEPSTASPAAAAA